MPAKRLSMRKIREVLRLKWAAGMSNRRIAASCGVSRPTVSEYLRRAESAGLRWPLPTTAVTRPVALAKSYIEAGAALSCGRVTVPGLPGCRLLHLQSHA